MSVIWMSSELVIVEDKDFEKIPLFGFFPIFGKLLIALKEKWLKILNFQNSKTSFIYHVLLNGHVLEIVIV